MKNKQIADRLLQEWSDRGMIVEGGWRAYELLTGLQDAPAVQRRECRKAFFLGAQHLFACVVSMLDPGTEPTDKDLKRMDLLDKELKQFLAELQQGRN